jgi:peptide/nickel transport system permease protein
VISGASWSVRPAQRHRTLRRFARHRLAVLGSAIILAIAFLALAAPLVAPIPPNRIDLSASAQAPSAAHWLGTDSTGRDQWSRLVYAGRVSLSVGLVATSIATAIGLLLGGLSGYYAGKVDLLIMRLTDTVMSFPSLIIIITVVAYVGPSIYNVMLAIGLLSWPGVCRLVRGQFLSLRQREFVIAAQAMGAPARALIFRHLLPNVSSPVIVAATFSVAYAILTEAGLSFLGLGVQPPTASWGNMLSAARQVDTIQNMPWLWIPPGALVALSVLAINFIGDGLRDAWDPRMDVG